MKNNPADKIEDPMWSFLATHGQQANIPRLKECVNDFIQLLTQKTGGQQSQSRKDDISIDNLDMILNEIVIEATALVLSGELDKLENKDD